MARSSTSFKPGNPGRKPGSKNKKPLEVKALAQALILDDADYLQGLVRRIKQGKAPQMEVLLWHYTYGKPTEPLEALTPLAIIIKQYTPPAASQAPSPPPGARTAPEEPAANGAVAVEITRYGQQ
jgi:hypothetical protein